MAHLLFMPSRANPRFFLWGDAPGAGGDGARPAALDELFTWSAPACERIVSEELSIKDVEGWAIPLLDALPLLAAADRLPLEQVSTSVDTWCLASKLALDLVARGRFVPRIRQGFGARTEARWSVSLALPGDAERAAALARAMPFAAHALPAPGAAVAASPGGARAFHGARCEALRVWPSAALLQAFLDAAADALVRASVAVLLGANSLAEAEAAGLEEPGSPGLLSKPVRLPTRGSGARGRSAPRAGRARSGGRSLPTPRLNWRGAARSTPWELRFAFALVSEDPVFEAAGSKERSLMAKLDAWVRPALGEVQR